MFKGANAFPLFLFVISIILFTLSVFNMQPKSLPTSASPFFASEPVKIQEDESSKGKKDLQMVDLKNNLASNCPEKTFSEAPHSPEEEICESIIRFMASNNYRLPKLSEYVHFFDLGASTVEDVGKRPGGAGVDFIEADFIEMKKNTHDVSDKDRIKNFVLLKKKDFSICETDLDSNKEDEYAVELAKDGNFFLFVFMKPLKDPIQVNIGDNSRCPGIFSVEYRKDDHTLFCGFEPASDNSGYWGWVNNGIQYVLPCSITDPHLGYAEEVEEVGGTFTSGYKFKLIATDSSWVSIETTDSEGKKEVIYCPAKDILDFRFSTGEGVNVRESYGRADYKTKKVLYMLSYGQKVRIIDTREDWTLITPDGDNWRGNKKFLDPKVEQWVKSEFLSLFPPSPKSDRAAANNAVTEESNPKPELELADLEMLWSMPSSFLGKKVNCLFTIIEIHEEADHYGVMVGDGRKLFDMKNPIAFEVRISKGDDSFVRSIVKLKGKRAILSGIVRKSESMIISHYLDVTNARYKSDD